jgi:Na+-transporting NADH:ubiquinone oxidoreductase subunit NqrD
MKNISTRTAAMIKAGYVMLAVYLTIAFVFWLQEDREHTLMFMGGSALWVIGLLVWYKIAEQEQEE